MISYQFLINNYLSLTVENAVKIIAFRAISTGVYHFPLERATKIAVTEVKKFLEKNESIEKVIFVCFDNETYGFYQSVLSS